MEELYDFLKKAGTYYLATDDNGQPRVRPFGTIDLYDGKLCIQTGRIKNVSKQIDANPNVELCAFMNGTWLRIAGKMQELDCRDARKHMLDAYPSLRSMYNEDDGNTQILCFTEGTATFSSFTEKERTIRF